MAISQKLKEYLDQNRVDYKTAEHGLAYTAQEIAGSQHVPGNEMVKSVIVKFGKTFIMCVLPAIHLIDFEKLGKLLNNQELRLATEEEIAKLFPDYEVGAEPPFGNLYGLKVYADRTLEENQSITFNAGTHTDVVKMRFSDYAKLAKPMMGNIGTHI